MDVEEFTKLTVRKRVKVLLDIWCNSPEYSDIQVEFDEYVKECYSKVASRAATRKENNG